MLMQLFCQMSGVSLIVLSNVFYPTFLFSPQYDG